MPIAQVNLYSERIGEPTNQFVNVFGYDVTTSAVTQTLFDDFVTQFKTDVLSKIQAVLSSTVQFTKMTYYDRNGLGIELENIFSTPATGGVSGECLPYFVGWGFQYVRAVAGQRSGSKRFAGVAESSQNEGVPTGTTATLLPTLATQLGTPVTAGAVTWTPVILHKTGSHTADGHAISRVLFKRCTTQNSRKR